MTRTPNIEPVGLIGLGLMGRGIATCLLANGFEVIAYNRTARRATAAVRHNQRTREERVRRKVARGAPPRDRPRLAHPFPVGAVGR
jgi:3-hydroxybutyryl-CoA dehydrogenase